MDQERLAQVTAGLPEDRAGRRASRGGSLSLRLIGLALVVLLAGEAAWADIMVQPVLLRLGVSPGREYTRTLRLENSNPKEDETVTLSLMELTQTLDGSWLELRPDDPNTSKAVLRSCMSWLSVPQEPIKLGAYKSIPFTLKMIVPGQTQGYYFAAIVATTAPRSAPLGTGVVAPINMQVVVPVLVEVQSQPVRRDISLADTGLVFQAQTIETPASNSVTIDVVNAGGTLSTLTPFARLWREERGHWAKVADIRFPDLMIMPGARLRLKRDAGEMLPSGTYRIEATVNIESQRGPVVKRTVQFAGDPAAKVLPGQASLGVRPSSLFADVLPGATRMATFQVANQSEEDVKVAAESVMPAHMAGAKISDTIRGDDLGCVDWMTVSPSSFPLRGHAVQTITVLIKVPREATKFRCYYGTVRLNASFPDGRPATTRETLVCVQNSKGPADTPNLLGRVLTIAELSPSRYQASAAFANIGTVYADSLRCEGALSIVGGGGGAAAIYKRFLLTSEEGNGPLLPANLRNFAGTLDLSDVPANVYLLTAILTWPGAPVDGVQRQIAVRVTEQGGRKSATMINLGETTGPTVIKL